MKAFPLSNHILLKSFSGGFQSISGCSLAGRLIAYHVEGEEKRFKDFLKEWTAVLVSPFFSEILMSFPVPAVLNQPH